MNTRGTTEVGTTEVRSTEVISVTYREDASRTVSVLCPYCGQVEELAWPAAPSGSGYVFQSRIPDTRAGCGQGMYRVRIPSWAYDVRYRTGYRKFLQANPVFAGGDFGRDEVTVGVDCSNDALSDPANNWEE